MHINLKIQNTYTSDLIEIMDNSSKAKLYQSLCKSLFESSTADAIFRILVTYIENETSFLYIEGCKSNKTIFHLMCEMSLITSPHLEDNQIDHFHILLEHLIEKYNVNIYIYIYIYRPLEKKKKRQ